MPHRKPRDLPLAIRHLRRRPCSSASWHMPTAPAATRRQSFLSRVRPLRTATVFTSPVEASKVRFNWDESPPAAPAELSLRVLVAEQVGPPDRYPHVGQVGTDDRMDVIPGPVREVAEP